MDIVNTLRQYKIHKIAVFDLGGTLLLSYILAKKMKVNPLIIMAASFPIGYVAHKLAKVDTPLTKKFDDLLLYNDSTKINTITEESEAN